MIFVNIPVHTIEKMWGNSFLVCKYLIYESCAINPLLISVSVRYVKMILCEKRICGVAPCALYLAPQLIHFLVIINFGWVCWVVFRLNMPSWSTWRRLDRHTLPTMKSLSLLTFFEQTPPVIGHPCSVPRVSMYRRFDCSVGHSFHGKACTCMSEIFQSRNWAGMWTHMRIFPAQLPGFKL